MTLVFMLTACGRVGYNALDADVVDAPTGVAPPVNLYFSSETTVERIPIDPLGTPSPFITSVPSPDGVAIDSANLVMYIADEADGRVYLTDLARSIPPVVVTTAINPEGIALDPASNTVFFTDKGVGTIEAMSYSGADRRVVASNLQDPDGLAFHAALGELFYSELTADTVSRIRPDGTGQQTIVTSTARPEGIAIDEENGQVYWIDRSRVRVTDVMGTNVTTLVTGILTDGLALISIIDNDTGWFTSPSILRRQSSSSAYGISK